MTWGPSGWEGSEGNRSRISYYIPTPSDLPVLCLRPSSSPRYLMAGLGSSSEDEGDSHSESGEDDTPKLPRKVWCPYRAKQGLPSYPCFLLLPPAGCQQPYCSTSPNPPSSAAPAQSQDPGSRTQLNPEATNPRRDQSTITRTPEQ